MVFFATVWTIAVFCGPTAGTGHYQPETQTIVLQPRACQALRAAPRLAPARIWDTTAAVFALAHEEGHAHDPTLIYPTDGAPVSDLAYWSSCGLVGPCEAYADCYAAGHMVALAETMGFSGYTARRLRGIAHSQRRSLGGYAAIPQRCWSY